MCLVYENGVKKLFEQKWLAKESYLLVYQKRGTNIGASTLLARNLCHDIDIGHYFEAKLEQLETLNRINQNI